MEHSPINISKAKYLDRKAGWFIYPFLGLSFLFFANDNEFETLVRLPSFKWDVLFSIIAAYTVGFYLAWLTRYLDKHERYSWETALKKRIIVQFLFGIAVPLIFCIGAEIIYLALINISISESSVFNLELPLSFIYLLIINLLYYLNHISFSYRKKLTENDDSRILEPTIKITEGAKEKLMPIQNIAFLRSTDKTLWLHTFQNQQFYLNGSLSEWEVKLPKKYFYKMNRQIIVHRDAIKSVEPTETRRLKAFIKNFDEEIYIPKTRATDFRSWWLN